MGLELPIIVILGLAAPFGIALLNKVKWSSKTKQLVALGVSIAASVLWLVATGGIGGLSDPTSLAVAATSIYTLTQIVYSFIFKNVLSKLEAATDKEAVVVIPDIEVPGNLVVTSSETVKVSEVTDSSANVTVDSPIEVAATNDHREPRG